VGQTADLLLTGGQIGEVRRGGQLVRVRVAPDLQVRGPADQLREATMRAGDGRGQPIPLGLLGRASFVTRPSTVRTESGELVAYVDVDLIDGTDPARYVERAQRELEREALDARGLQLEGGERIEWTGQYHLFEAGKRRLRWIAPLMAVAMLGLLFVQFRNWTEALLVFVSVPFALVGSIWTLFVLHYPLSAPVWVGLLSVIGLAMQTGVVMVVYIDESFHRRVREGRIKARSDIVAAHTDGTVRRLRPKLMTITTMAMGLFPLVWADGAGSEVMRRVAAPMLGGLATSAFLTLEVLPVLYTIWRSRQLQLAERTGVPIDQVVGTVPPWARE
jgi:Cu(I)/Ag(I) efflux system membrane protein CusA/SilA